MTHKPELFILNDFDKPDERHVVQKIGPHQYKYIHPDLENWRTMERDEGTTPLSEFGIDYQVMEERNAISLYITRLSTAKYRDGTPRQWQGAERFYLPYNKPLVQMVG